MAIVLSSGTYVARFTLFGMTGATPDEYTVFGVDAYVLDVSTGSPAVVSYSLFGDVLSLDGDPDIAFALAPGGWRPTTVTFRKTPGGSDGIGVVMASGNFDCSVHGEASIASAYGVWTGGTVAPTFPGACNVAFTDHGPGVVTPTTKVEIQSGLDVTLAVSDGGTAAVAKLFEIYGAYDVLAIWWTIPVLSACGDRQESHHQLVAEGTDPGAPWVRLDPLDDDAAPVPTVTNVTPNHGPIAGLTAITIDGSGFGDGCTVEVDGVPATNVVVVSQFQITCDVPAHAAGSAPVVVTNEDGVVSV